MKHIKKIPTLILLLFISISNAQIAVVNPSSEAQLIAINTKLTLLNKATIKQTQVLNKLLSEMKKNNEKTEKIRAYEQEIVEGKKNAPEFVLKSYEVENIIELKSDVVQILKNLKKSVDVLTDLKGNEKKDFVVFYKRKMEEIFYLFKASKDVIGSKSLIEPEQRINIIKNNTDKVKDHLDKLNLYSNNLIKLSEGRKVSNTLINKF